jgi:hypothetical protein
MPTITRLPGSPGAPANPAPNRMTAVRGWLLVVLGSLLACGMLYALVSQAPLMLAPGSTIDGDTFTGSAEQGRAALALFGAVVLVGALFVAGGVQLLRHGRLRRWLVVTVLAAGTLLAIMARHVSALF